MLTKVMNEIVNYIALRVIQLVTDYKRNLLLHRSYNTTVLHK